MGKGVSTRLACAPISGFGADAACIPAFLLAIF